MNDWVNVILKKPDESMECLIKFKDGTITGAYYDIKSKCFEPIYVEIDNSIVNYGSDIRNYRDDPQDDIDLNDHYLIVFHNQPTHWKLIE